ncbi:hypothetical protein PoB_005853900 [Plakobranchus ocellatus]|uniref:Uncharacterized protein n=1 Tax=Plakobranchus ocellatus TaxID=259542 RepID=A0AAV4CL90_9GAST|nr:hypothetical protein PoB_005853900 [Plakobranchus ocellatus]
MIPFKIPGVECANEAFDVLRDHSVFPGKEDPEPPGATLIDFTDNHVGLPWCDDLAATMNFTCSNSCKPKTLNMKRKEPMRHTILTIDEAFYEKEREEKEIKEREKKRL